MGPRADATEGRLADKSTQLIVEALSKAVADPDGLPLFAAKAAPGLFPATDTARLSAQRCHDEGWLKPVRTDTAGKQPRDLYGVTDKGLAWLLNRTSPRQVLEDLVRAVEARQEQLAELADAVRRTRDGLDALRALAEQVLPQVRPPSLNGHAHAPEPGCDDRVLAELERRHGDGSPAAMADCPLPELFRCVASERLTVGRFHDALRRLHDAGRVWLHPWTGPLYELPEPAYALLVGHEVAYYASARAA